MIENIINIANHFQKLSKKEFQQYLIAILLGVGGIAIASMYYIYSQSSKQKERIQQLNKNYNQITDILAQNEQLQKEEQHVREILDKQTNFNMRSHFERFYTKHKTTPEAGWEPEYGEPIEGTEEDIKFQEIILRAKFNNQTMQTLISLLQDIYSEEIIYLKGLDLTIKESKIDFELTIATKQYKKESEETE